MLLAADLHLHSRYAGGVSPAMTIENIARTAQAKGLDLLATGDGLQEAWLQEIESALEEAEPGLFSLRPKTAQAAEQGLAEKLRRPLRFVLSVEVCCAPPGTASLGGIHHLIYFPTLQTAREFRRQMLRHGDLQEGRPVLDLSSKQLLEALLSHDPACHLAPAHVFNPWYSTLGSRNGGTGLEDSFEELTPRLLALETGLTSNPAMCRRVSALDRHALFSCSDAHSLESLGRECTLLDIEPSYSALFTALRNGMLIGTIKFPVERTRYFLNRCGICKESFPGTRCPRCGRPLVKGVRDRLEEIADRLEPVFPAPNPPFLEILPLGYLLADLLHVKRGSKSITSLQDRLLESLGHERFILTEAPYEAIERVTTPELARAIVRQRTVKPPARPKSPKPDLKDKPDQLSLGF